MAPKLNAQKFILLPPLGLQAGMELSNPATTSFMSTVHALATATTHAVAGTLPNFKIKMKILDSIREHGAKLVEMTPQQASDLRADQPGVRIVPVVYYYPAIAPRPIPVSPPTTSASSTNLKIMLKVVSAKDGKPVAGATVTAFTDFASRIGKSGTTNAKGQVSFSFGASKKKVQRLYIYSKKDFWNFMKKNLTLSAGMEVGMLPIDLAFTDVLRFFYGNAPDDAGQGVAVGVIDTGIAAEPDLLIDGGFNAVTGEDANDFGDNGEGHGTHVAGIIAARGKPPAGIRGLAPAVKLRSYRVFGRGAEGASNFDILKALDRAVQDGCDLVNMSLGSQGKTDEATHDAIAHARANGVLVLAASGNDDRSPVGNPANDPLAIAVSALGRKGTYPPNTVEGGDVQSPFGADSKNYITSFSNVGQEIDLTGPGDGVISTFPGGYAILDGTSMACPAVTGMAAKLLATRPDILGMSRDQARSDAIAKALFQKAKALGFGPTFEGQGLVKV
jgi:subtilisin